MDDDDGDSNGLLSQAWSISSIGRAHTEIAARHRQAAAALRTGKWKTLTFNSHFKDWLLNMSILPGAAENLIASEVRIARTFGVSWTEIGEAFGISRQAAWERFARKYRWDRAQPVLRANQADRASFDRETELRRRKAKLIKELTNREYNDHELAALERTLDIKSTLDKKKGR